MRGQHRKLYTNGVPSVQSICPHTSYALTKALLAPRHRRYEKCLCTRILTPVGNQLPHPISKINPRVRQRLSWGRTIAVLGYRQTRRGETDERTHGCEGRHHLQLVSRLPSGLHERRRNIS